MFDQEKCLLCRVGRSVAAVNETEKRSSKSVGQVDQTSKEPSGVSINSAGNGGWQVPVLAL